MNLDIFPDETLEMLHEALGHAYEEADDRASKANPDWKEWRDALEELMEKRDLDFEHIVLAGEPQEEDEDDSEEQEDDGEEREDEGEDGEEDKPKAKGRKKDDDDEEDEDDDDDKPKAKGRSKAEDDGDDDEKPKKKRK